MNVRKCAKSRLWVAVVTALCLSLTACDAPQMSTSASLSASAAPNDLAELSYKYDNRYTLNQAMSDNAQLSTIAFNGLAFITGDPNADTFFPPGKVADFFGFQYMRDVDAAGYGHNTTFLTKAAMTVLSVLDDNQKQQLIELARTQTPTYADFAFNRLPLIHAFRRTLEGSVPTPDATLDIDTVAAYTRNLYQQDAQLSIGRAEVVGHIIHGLTTEQRASLDKLAFNDSSTWPDLPEDEAIKKSMTNFEYQTLMTYASEFLSWYLGDIASDTYFCPERHGTYFGGFFMKDFPAMGNPDYFISTSITGDKGQEFLDVLNEGQRREITEIIEEQRPLLEDIAQTRWAIAVKLRLAESGAALDEAALTSLIAHYGELDGRVSGLYAQRFADVNETLTPDQRLKLSDLRDLAVIAPSAYRFATEVPNPDLPNTDYFFSNEPLPVGAGTLTAPDDFATADLQHDRGNSKGQTK